MIRSLGRLCRFTRAVRAASGVHREEAFWDEYVRTVGSSRDRRALPYIGSDWMQETGFLSVLRRYAPRGRQALEIGCGGGRITAAATGLFAHIRAADVSREMLRECAAAVAAPNVSIHKIDGYTLKEFGDESVDCVYSHDVFVQLASVETYPYLREIMRVLKRDGIGVISFYDFVTRFDLFQENSLRLWATRRSAHGRRLHFVTEEMLQLMLLDVGAEVIEMHKEAFLTAVFRRVR